MTSLKAAVRIHRRIAEVGREAWDACAGPGNPFVSFDFLYALEEAGCASDRTGWAPHHLSVEDDAGETAAVTLTVPPVAVPARVSAEAPVALAVAVSPAAAIDPCDTIDTEPACTSGVVVEPAGGPSTP